MSIPPSALVRQRTTVPGAYGLPRPPGPVFLLDMRWPSEDADAGNGAPIGLALVVEHAARRVDGSAR